MKPSKALAAHRAELRQLASHYGSSHPRIFGSVLTGTDDIKATLICWLTLLNTGLYFIARALEIDTLIRGKLHGRRLFSTTA